MPNTEPQMANTEVLQTADTLLDRISDLIQRQDRLLAERSDLEHAHRKITNAPLKVSGYDFRELPEFGDASGLYGHQYERLQVTGLPNLLKDLREQRLYTRVKELRAWEAYRAAIKPLENGRSMIRNHADWILRARSETTRPVTDSDQAPAVEEPSPDVTLLERIEADIREVEDLVRIAEEKQTKLHDRQSRWQHQEYLESERNKAAEARVAADRADLESTDRTMKRQGRSPEEIKARHTERLRAIIARELVIGQELDLPRFTSTNDLRIPARDLAAAVTSHLIRELFQLTGSADPSPLWRLRFEQFVAALSVIGQADKPASAGELKRYLTELAQVEDALAQHGSAGAESLRDRGVWSTRLPAGDAGLAARLESLTRIRSALAQQAQAGQERQGASTISRLIERGWQATAAASRGFFVERLRRLRPFGERIGVNLPDWNESDLESAKAQAQ
jgi:hypothetical protein